jgi:hypothetical protein
MMAQRLNRWAAHASQTSAKADYHSTALQATKLLVAAVRNQQQGNGSWEATKERALDVVEGRTPPNVKSAALKEGVMSIAEANVQSKSAAATLVDFASRLACEGKMNQAVLLAEAAARVGGAAQRATVSTGIARLIAESRVRDKNGGYPIVAKDLLPTSPLRQALRNKGTVRAEVRKFDALQETAQLRCSLCDGSRFF